MHEIVVDLFLTVDGAASGSASPAFFGFAGPDLDAWIQAELEKPQVLTMGRVTYTLMAAQCDGSDDVGARRMTALPKLVFSKTLPDSLPWANSRRVTATDRDAALDLKRQAEATLRVIGSLTLARTLIALGVVDRMRLLVFPQVLGATGREPAFAGYPDVDLQLVRTQLLDDRLVLLEYRIR